MSGLFYKLKEGVILRGWLDLPLAISNQVTGQTFSISKEQFDLLSVCDGKTNIENSNLNALINTLKSKNVIEQCKEEQNIAEEQKFKFYNCRYIKKVDWSITGRCNYLCKHCFVSAPSNRFGELPLSICFDFIDQFAECGIRNVLLTGGEPLLRKDLLQIIDKLISQNICIETLSTNGSLLTEKLLSEFKARKLNTTFALSFDGLGCHDYLRGVPDAEKHFTKAIELLSKYNFPIIVRMTTHSKNLHSIIPTINFLSQFNLKEFKIGSVITSGDWRKQPDRDLDIKKLYNVYLNTIDYFIRNNSPINLHIAGFFCCAKNNTNYVIPNAKFDGSESAKNQFLCKHTKTMLYLSGDGQLLPCMAVSGMDVKRNSNKKLSLLENRLYYILAGKEQMKDTGKQLSYLLKVNKECRVCNYKFFCGGGCRASAASLTSNYYGCDEYMCVFYKNNYAQQIANTVQNAIL